MIYSSAPGPCPRLWNDTSFLHTPAAISHLGNAFSSSELVSISAWLSCNYSGFLYEDFSAWISHDLTEELSVSYTWAIVSRCPVFIRQNTSTFTYTNLPSLSTQLSYSCLLLSACPCKAHLLMHIHVCTLWWGMVGTEKGGRPRTCCECMRDYVHLLHTCFFA